MRRLISVGGVALALLLFLLANLLGNTLFKAARFDLTENKLYTLSEGTKNVLAGLNEEVRLRFFFSKKLAGEAPGLADYAERVQEMLEEFVAHGGGQVSLEVFDPEPFSEEEDRAVEFGLQGVPVNTAGEKIYFGLAGTNTTDQEEALPFFDERREESLEYDITKLVYNLSNPDRNVVGLLTKLPLDGDFMARMRNPQAPPDAWFILEQMRQLFDVRTLPADVDRVEEGIDVLMVVHPQDLPQKTLYAIDQFVLGGGKALVFLDPHCEEQQVQQDPQNPLSGMMANRSSTLGPLLEAWGLSMSVDDVAGDSKSALRVNFQGRPADYLVWLGLRRENDCLDEEDFVTSELKTLNLASAGVLQARSDATTTITPLLTTTRDSMRVQKSMIQFGPNPGELMRSFVAGDERLMLGARVSGPARTAFPAGNPEPPAPKDGEPPEPAPEPLQESQGPINVIVIADADLLADQFWVRVQNILGMRIPSISADNGALVINAIDNLCGSNDLISLRSRGKFSRPFDRVAEIRREAEQKFRQKEKELQDKLRDTEQKINELQQGRQDGASATILTPEQRAEIEKFQEDRSRTRTELRRVNHELNKDIESLGTKLKLANVFGLPFLVIAFALVTTALRSGKRRS